MKLIMRDDVKVDNIYCYYRRTPSFTELFYFKVLECHEDDIYCTSVDGMTYLRYCTVDDGVRSLDTSSFSDPQFELDIGVSNHYIFELDLLEISEVI